MVVAPSVAVSAFYRSMCALEPIGMARTERRWRATLGSIDVDVLTRLRAQRVYALRTHGGRRVITQAGGRLMRCGDGLRPSYESVPGVVVTGREPFGSSGGLRNARAD